MALPQNKINYAKSIEALFHIENKEKVLVPFKLKPIQRDFLNTMTGWDVVVKPAQVGFTSLIMVTFLLDCITTEGTVAVVIAHEEFLTQHLLAKAQFFYDKLKELDIPGLIIPEMHHKSSYEKTFPSMHSSFYIGSARAFVFGMGETIHDLLASEYAFWPDPEKIMVPIMQRVPISGRFIIESTANGEDNAFCDTYRAGKEGIKTEKAVFTPHFYPWWLEPDYSLPRNSPYALKADRGKLDFDNEEQLLIKLHNLTEDQIRWRRRKIAENEQLRLTGESRMMFFQEYPEDDTTCFLTYGNAVYDLALLTNKAKECYKAPYSFNGAKVWYQPEKDIRYVVSVDPGQAKNTKSAITVWSFSIDDGLERAKHCATSEGLFDYELTAKKAKELSDYYNRAMISVESNSHGLAVIAELKRLGVLSRLYIRRDVITGKITNDIGWLTTGGMRGTKAYMIKEVTILLPNLITHDIDLIGEMRSLRYGGKTGMAIETASFDDLHDSAAIAIATRPHHIIKRGKIGNAGWKW